MCHDIDRSHRSKSPFYPLACGFQRAGANKFLSPKTQVSLAQLGVAHYVTYSAITSACGESPLLLLRYPGPQPSFRVSQPASLQRAGSSWLFPSSLHTRGSWAHGSAKRHPKAARTLRNPSQLRFTPLGLCIRSVAKALLCTSKLAGTALGALSRVGLLVDTIQLEV